MEPLGSYAYFEGPASSPHSCYDCAHRKVDLGKSYCDKARIFYRKKNFSGMKPIASLSRRACKYHVLQQEADVAAYGFSRPMA